MTRRFRMRSKFATKVGVQWSFNGRSQTVREWANELGLNPTTLRRRVYNSGYSIEEALSNVKLSAKITSRMGRPKKPHIGPVENLTARRQTRSNGECTVHLGLANSSGTSGRPGVLQACQEDLVPGCRTVSDQYGGRI